MTRKTIFFETCLQTHGLSKIQNFENKEFMFSHKFLRMQLSLVCILACLSVGKPKPVSFKYFLSVNYCYAEYSPNIFVLVFPCWNVTKNLSLTTASVSLELAYCQWLFDGYYIYAYIANSMSIFYDVWEIKPSKTVDLAFPWISEKKKIDTFYVLCILSLKLLQWDYLDTRASIPLGY